MVRWLATLKVVGSPFTMFTLVQLRVSAFGWVCVVGVAGWNIMSGSWFSRVSRLWGVRGSACCWVLRGHLWVGCFFWLRPAWVV